MDFDEIKIFPLERFADNRGAFTKMLSTEQHPIKETYLTYNEAKVVRGMHFQIGQGKYVACLEGYVHDYIMDVRTWSPNYGEFMTFLLYPERGTVFIPDGFAHGFFSPKNSTILYGMTDTFKPHLYYTVCPLGIMRLNGEYIISDKDKNADTLSGYFLEATC